MSFGGFKSFNVDVYGVTTGTMADVGTAIQSIADGIIGTGEGWSVDTSKNATTAYVDQVSVNGEAQALFLEHTSGARLMISMNLDQMGFDISTVMNWEFQTPQLDGAVYGGLNMCMLESGDDFDVANITSSSFLPSYAMRIMGTGYSYSASVVPGFLYDALPQYFMRYLVAVRGTQIIVLARRNDWNDSFFLLTLGDIFDCANNADTHAFGAFHPLTTSSAKENDSAGPIDPSHYNIASNSGNAQFYASDGTLLSGQVVLGAGLSEGAAMCDVDATPCQYSCGSNQRRFVPIYAMMKITQSGYGVVANDGYKGIINPEVCCRTYYQGSLSADLTGDTLLDSGNIKYIGCGLCIGWDASNVNNFWS